VILITNKTPQTIKEMVAGYIRRNNAY